MQPGEARLTAPARTRTPPAIFGMVLFLASELMFFGGLFAAYFTLRSTTSPWPPSDVVLEMPLTVAATIVLTISSFTMHAAAVRVRAADPSGARLWVWVTFALGAAFLAVKIYEMATASFGVGSHAYGTLWFTMLGAHGVHLGVGLILLAVLVAMTRKETGRIGAETVGYYWHFVDVVWLALFATIYLIR